MASSATCNIACQDNDCYSTRLADAHPLTDEQIQIFLRDGVLVVDNILNQEELNAARHGLNETLRKHHVNPEDLPNTAANLKSLSSTNGSGGVLDIFYPGWKFDVATNAKLLAVICQLWEAGFRNRDNDDETKPKTARNGFGHDGTSSSDEDYNQEENDDFRCHPFGTFDCNRAFAYTDRIGYRIPTSISEDIGKQELQQQQQKGSEPKVVKKKKNRPRPLQRSLTPHLDCCPDTILSGDVSNISKWRPIQSFVSLTDNLEPNTGGFEAALGFHRNFRHWAKSRTPTVGNNGQHRNLCVGEFTPIRPMEDKHVLSQVQHVPCRAGSAVIWDNRIPHSNARRNDSAIPRAVVYASFLPHVDINCRYVAAQLSSYLEGKIPTDQWIEFKDGEEDGTPAEEVEEGVYEFSNLGRKLMGIDSWD